ncbi:oxidoreductase [Dietzia kunjamensis]|uniref:oxidoreductase n=1 Tax=Dietzia TaxID=37914 RepID=UPI0022B30995|nr:MULTISPECIES: oxidoreductase [Dietzia]MCZ4654642.1 oxidoreductase [Dietzia kunjamensis]MDJ0421517.1 oxidoreductase [Dietzia kunjamensis]MDV3356516.1 oxidoreductase [Dietzia sp. IN118]
MTSTAPDPLAPLLALPGVAEAADAARAALASVHRHPANRRGWPTTAAESVLRGARASAGVEGASVRLDTDGEQDEVLSAALRVAGELTGESLDRAVSVWTRSPLQELAHLHLLAASGPGVDPQGLGRPRPEEGVAERLQGLAELVTGGTRAPAPVLAAVVLGELLGLRPFGSADGIVARAAFRLVGVSTGLDPHCLGVPEVTFYRDPEAHRAAIEGYMGGTGEGVTEWLLHCCRALEAGAREATSIADAAGG